MITSSRFATPFGRLPFATRRELFLPTVNELYKEHEQLKHEGKHAEAIGKLEELLKQDDKHVLTHLALSVLYPKSKSTIWPYSTPRERSKSSRRTRSTGRR